MSTEGGSFASIKRRMINAISPGSKWVNVTRSKGVRDGSIDEPPDLYRFGPIKLEIHESAPK
ncbi:MAG: hypothetical protein U5L74_07180 [Ideonella sp.]|nr:hypothetical protein [Ideonella sp.]